MEKLLARGLAASAVLVMASVILTPQQPNQTRRIPQFENDEVKVWKGIVMPNQPLTMHRHDHPRIIIPIVGGTMKIVQQSGGSETHQWEAGKAYWLTTDPPNQLHADVNAGGKPIELIAVELKNAK
ncbi:MAG: hypothetical protein DMG59_27085 [Acidobacteria bacterium]|jgi:hypothetical protein|nr:MAG: hypothetical protein DMG59_27085 [Acidobacteriota bacterium]